MSNVKKYLFHAIADFKQFVFANIYKEQISDNVPPVAKQAEDYINYNCEIPEMHL